MFSKIFAALAVATIAVSAQSASDTASAPDATSSALAGLSPCVIACISGAAVINGCSDFTDAACVCASAQAQTDAAACLSERCTSSDLAAAVALQTSQCAAVGVTPTGTPSGANSVPFTLSSSSTETGGSSTTGSSASTTPTSSGTAGSSSTPRTSATSPTTGTAAPTNTAGTSSAATLTGLRGAAAFIGPIIAGALIF